MNKQTKKPYSGEVELCVECGAPAPHGHKRCWMCDHFPAQFLPNDKDELMDDKNERRPL